MSGSAITLTTIIRLTLAKSERPVKTLEQILGNVRLFEFESWQNKLLDLGLA